MDPLFLSSRSKRSLVAGAVSAAALVMMGAGCGQTDQVAMPTAPVATPPPVVNNEQDMATPLVPASVVANEQGMAAPEVPAPVAPTPTAPAPTPSVTVSPYKDGMYTAKGNYMVHSGPEEITISITLKDGLITDTTFAGTPAVKMSQKFMDMFSQNYKPMVIGKKISDLKLGKVSGSSLTPMGFNDAVEKIKQQAAQSS